MSRESQTDNSRTGPSQTKAMHSTEIPFKGPDIASGSKQDLPKDCPKGA
jgi:hypothetical protein